MAGIYMCVKQAEADADTWMVSTALVVAEPGKAPCTCTMHHVMVFKIHEIQHMV